MNTNVEQGTGVWPALVNPALPQSGSFKFLLINTNGLQNRPLLDKTKDGSFVKLREIGVSYNLIPKALGMSNLTLGLSARNLISWDKYPGFDPEVNSGGQSNRIRGDDFGAVPIPRTFQFTVTAQF
jgi:hypothetical protein